MKTLLFLVKPVIESKRSFDLRIGGGIFRFGSGIEENGTPVMTSQNKTEPWKA
jgi:hypothetical protein